MKAINLIPPEAAQRAAARRKRFGIIMLGVIYVALLAVGFMYFRGQQTEVKDRLAIQQSDNAAVRAEVVALAPAADLQRELRNGSDQVERILVADIAWGRLLNDLGRVIPDRVWLDSFTAASLIDDENPAARGSVAMNRIAFDFPDAASWLRTLDSDRWPAIGTGWVLSTSAEEIVDGVPAVRFSSIGVLTTAALDDRLNDRIPSVPE